MSLTPHTSVASTGQSLTPGALVALYVVDLSPIGHNVQVAFTSNSDRARGQPILFGGRSYAPLDVKCTGFDYNGQGALPQPKIEITNVTKVMSSAAIIYHDLVGARLTRIRTYSHFLDNGETPDPSATYPVDVYSFEQKTQHTKTTIKWTLSAAMDQEGRLLPGRTVIRDVCPWRYRRWDRDTNTFDYTGVKCPYSGEQSYDKFGNPTTPDKDEPGRHVGDCCKVRFGIKSPLPFGGFPGVTRIRV